MKKQEKIGFIIAPLIGLIAIIFDTEIIKFVASMRSFIPDWIFIGFTFEMQTFLVLFILTSLFLFNEGKRRWIFPLWLTAGLSIIVSYIIKTTVLRPRPYQSGVVSVLGMAAHLIGESATTWNYSFPSFQAMLAFAAIPLLSKEFRKIKWIWVIIAVLIAFSRVYFGVHYASDVIFGATIGYFIGWAVVKLELRNNFGERCYNRIKGLKKYFK